MATDSDNIKEIPMPPGVHWHDPKNANMVMPAQFDTTHDLAVWIEKYTDGTRTADGKPEYGGIARRVNWFLYYGIKVNDLQGFHAGGVDPHDLYEVPYKINLSTMDLTKVRVAFGAASGETGSSTTTDETFSSTMLAGGGGGSGSGGSSGTSETSSLSTGGATNPDLREVPLPPGRYMKDDAVMPEHFASAHDLATWLHDHVGNSAHDAGGKSLFGGLARQVNYFLHYGIKCDDLQGFPATGQDPEQLYGKYFQMQGIPYAVNPNKIKIAIGDLADAGASSSSTVDHSLTTTLAASSHASDSSSGASTTDGTANDHIGMTSVPLPPGWAMKDDAVMPSHFDSVHDLAMWLHDHAERDGLHGGYARAVNWFLQRGITADDLQGFSPGGSDPHYEKYGEVVSTSSVWVSGLLASADVPHHNEQDNLAFDTGNSFSAYDQRGLSTDSFMPGVDGADSHGTAKA